MPADSASDLDTCLALASSISHSADAEPIYTAALDALEEALGVHRAAILLFDPDGRMRFKASRGLSSTYTRAVEGHTPWRPDDVEARPIVVGNVTEDASLEPFLATLQNEGIAAMAFIPLMSRNRVIGKFMVYYDRPYELSAGELRLVSLVAAQVAFAVDRAHAENAANETARLKDEFLATLSHELRTPLNAIVGWIQILRSGALEPGQKARALDIIDRNARLQAKTIEDILDVSRIITGDLEIAREVVSLGAIVDYAVNAVQPIADSKHIVIESPTATDLPSIEGDQRRLQQVLTNVLTNAVTFSDENRRVKIDWSASPDSVTLEVTDTGEGIPPEFLPHVFERFRQADASPSRRHGGLGLGLAIAKAIVESHGGTIGARSHGEGRGTTVRVVLPCVQTGAAPFSQHDGPTDRATARVMRRAHIAR